jgi:hypothetical protein
VISMVLGAVLTLIFMQNEKSAKQAADSASGLAVAGG